MVSANSPSLVQKTAKIRAQWEAQRLQFYNQLGLPHSTKALYADLWRVVAQVSSPNTLTVINTIIHFVQASRTSSIAIDQLCDLWESEGLRLKRQILEYDVDEVVLDPDNCSDHMMAALREGYESFYQNPLYCATGRKHVHGECPCLNPCYNVCVCVE